MLVNYSINDCPYARLCLTAFISQSVYVFNTVHASHIETTVLPDGTYELIQESEGGDLEVQVNAAVLTGAPDQSSEEPRAEIVNDYREGKPRT